jgi:hypothetical protein
LHIRECFGASCPPARYEGPSDIDGITASAEVRWFFGPVMLATSAGPGVYGLADPIRTRGAPAVLRLAATTGIRLGKRILLTVEAQHVRLYQAQPSENPSRLVPVIIGLAIR